MRTLHIIGTLDPASGGPAASVTMLIEFSRSSFRSEVVTLDDPASPHLQDLSFPITALGPTHTKFAYNRRLIPWLTTNQNRFDAVVIHGLWQFCGFAVWWVFAGKKPYFVFAHGMLDPYFKHAFPAKHLKKWVYWIVGEYRVLRDASKVLFTCDEEERLAHQSFWLHRWSSAIIPYGSRMPPSNIEPFSRDFLECLPRLVNRRYLLFLGRIDRKKGCDLLIDAFIATAADEPDLDLVMAGPDPTKWRPALERCLHDASLAHRVHWPGMLHGSQKWGAFARCEAFVLPSHQENFGIAVAEALSCAKPVLLSDKVNIASEIVADGAGLVDTDTRAGTTRLLQRWIKMTPAQRDAMGSRALTCFLGRFDMRRNTAAFTELLERTVHLQSGETSETARAAAL